VLEKVIRGTRRDDSAVPKGMQIHHSYIRPHRGLDGDTHDKAGIRITERNEWKTIMRDAVKSPGSRPVPGRISSR